MKKPASGQQGASGLRDVSDLDLRRYGISRRQGNIDFDANWMYLIMWGPETDEDPTYLELINALANREDDKRYKYRS